MELEKYQALVCAIETGSLSAAAERLQYTPSGISRMIASLEAENGFALLVREHDGVRPTPECAALMPRIVELLHSGDACRQLAARIRGLDVGQVLIGSAYSIFYPWLGRVLGDFHSRYPHITVHFTDGFSTGLLEKLNGHEIDLCLITKREGRHDWLPISRDRLMAWVPEGHPLAALPVFPLKRFEEAPYITTFPGTDLDATRVFEANGIHPKQVYSTWNSLATYSMVEAGLGLTLNHEFNADARTGSVRMIPVDPPQTTEIGIASLPDINHASARFVQVLREHIAELAEFGLAGAAK